MTIIRCLSELRSVKEFVRIIVKCPIEWKFAMSLL